MRRILIIPVIAGLLLTLGACGAKEEASTSTADAPAAKSSGESGQSPSTTAKDTTTSGDGTDDKDSTGSDDAPSDLPSQLDNDCIALSTLYVSVMAQSTTAMIPGGASADELEELEKDLEEARAKADIPDELTDAFAVWSEAWEEFGATMSELGDGGLMTPEGAAKIEEATKKIEDPEVKDAGKKIEDYVTEHCAGGAPTETP